MAINLAKSTGGARTWSAPQQVSDAPAGVAAFTPSVDVNADGAVGVTFYDSRNDTTTTATALTDHWIRTSTNGGAVGRTGPDARAPPLDPAAQAGRDWTPASPGTPILACTIDGLQDAGSAPS